MNSRDNCAYIIDDPHFDKYCGDVNCIRTKRGYKLKYFKDKSYAPFSGDGIWGDNGDIDIIIFPLVGAVLGAIQLGIIAGIHCVYAWCALPVLVMYHIGWQFFHSENYAIVDLIRSLFFLIVIIGVTWGVLAGAYNNNFYNVETEWGLHGYNYVREVVNPNWLFLK